MLQAKRLRNAVDRHRHSADLMIERGVTVPRKRLDDGKAPCMGGCGRRIFTAFCDICAPPRVDLSRHLNEPARLANIDPHDRRWNGEAMEPLHQANKDNY